MTSFQPLNLFAASALPVISTRPVAAREVPAAEDETDAQRAAQRQRRVSGHVLCLRCHAPLLGGRECGLHKTRKGEI
jgi:hypothetical protein